MKIDFTVYGKPQALKRHRTVKMGKFMRQYDPSSSDKQDFLAKCMENKPDKPIDEPLQLILHFYFTRPKSHYRTGKNSHIEKDNAPMWHSSRPDCDNLAKFVCDALNGVYWRDDSLISSLIVKKLYSDKPRTRVVVEQIKFI